MSDITIPAQHEMMPELLQAMRELGGSGSIAEINVRTRALLNLPEAVLNAPHGDSSQTEVDYRLAWARSYLKKVGILENSTRGVWALTAQGRALQDIDPQAVVRAVRAQRSQASAASPIPDGPPAGAAMEAGQDVPPEQGPGWEERLRAVLLSLPPDAFERLAQRMLREMGFVQVEVTGRTGDGGLDGVGMLRLGGVLTFRLYFQCKRYQGSVGSREIRDFRGALQGRADKGLFLTTGRFTSDAVREAARPGALAIDLMDGGDVAQRLRELELGVHPVVDYTVDEDWFRSI